MRAFRVADVRHQRGAELRRSRHAPTHHLELPLAIGDTDDRRELVWINVGQRRQIARQVARRGEDVSEAKRLKALEDENAKLKRLLADAMLDAAALKELLGKKW